MLRTDCVAYTSLSSSSSSIKVNLCASAFNYRLNWILKDFWQWLQWVSQTSILLPLLRLLICMIIRCRSLHHSLGLHLTNEAKVCSRYDPPVSEVFCLNSEHQRGKKKPQTSRVQLNNSPAETAVNTSARWEAAASHLSSSTWSYYSSEAGCDGRDTLVCEHSGITATTASCQLFPSGKLKLNQDTNHLSARTICGHFH